ncbi:hypothetical protein CHS0354_021146, partial [Potamilus streckersoni]
MTISLKTVFAMVSRVILKYLFCAKKKKIQGSVPGPSSFLADDLSNGLLRNPLWTVTGEPWLVDSSLPERKMELKILCGCVVDVT